MKTFNDVMSSSIDDVINDMMTVSELDVIQMQGRGYNASLNVCLMTGMSLEEAKSFVQYCGSRFSSFASRGKLDEAYKHFVKAQEISDAKFFMQKSLQAMRSRY